MLVEITQEGKDYWDSNRAKTEVGQEIRVRDSSSLKDKALFVLGLVYGAGAQDTEDLTKVDPAWKGVLDYLEDSSLIAVVDESSTRELGG